MKRACAMKKYSIIFLLLLFSLFVPQESRSDEITTIQSFLNNKTEDAGILHGVYMACLELTRSGTEEAVEVLKQLLDDERFSTVARTAIANIKGDPAPPLQDHPSEEAALLALILKDDKPGLPALVAALKDEKTPFKVVLRAVLELKSDQTGTIVLDNMGDLPAWQQAALVRNLGARKDATIVPRLIDLATNKSRNGAERNDGFLLQLAAIEALGEIGDARAVDTLLVAASSEDAELAEAAVENLKLFQGEEFNEEIIGLLDNNDKKLRLAALDIIGERTIAVERDQMEALFLDSDEQIRTTAYKAFAKSVTPTATDIALCLAILKKRSGDEQNAIRDTITILCRKIADRESAAHLFVILDDTDPQVGRFYLDCLFQLGGEKAAQYIFWAAMGTDDALINKATELLGRWTTPEVAPYLIEIAEKHPIERYRVRTLSGYLRVIRQMGLPVEQKVQMAEKAVAVARRPADRQRALEVLERFQTMMRGVLIFDGKTFDGWEFRGNEQWFRIEDGAIVGGTLEEPIPHNEFLVSVKEYGDFTLRLECKAIGAGCNGGIQFRSFRHAADGPQPNEMIGYQADMTDDAAYWGAIYDESRRNRFVAQPPKELIESIFRPNDWNEYEIVCKGNNIKLFLNGTLTADYTEEDESIPPYGFIGLQIHSGPPSETWYRNIRIEE